MLGIPQGTLESKRRYHPWKVLEQSQKPSQAHNAYMHNVFKAVAFFTAQYSTFIVQTR